MNILVTNDDSYQSEGIISLYNVLAVKHNVYMCAPMRQMSSTSHAITLFKPMEIKWLSERQCTVDGTPADCVKVALTGVFQDVAFDMVISGINDWPNMGEDTFYSGTVAGAREGLINNIFSIACSIDGWTDKNNFSYPAEYMGKFVDAIDEDLLKEKLILNINFPNSNTVKGIKFSHLGNRVYQNVIEHTEEDGKKYVAIAGEHPSFSYNKDSDLDCVSRGYISITPLTNELFDKSAINKLTALQKIQL